MTSPEQYKFLPPCLSILAGMSLRQDQQIEHIREKNQIVFQPIRRSQSVFVPNVSKSYKIKENRSYKELTNVLILRKKNFQRRSTNQKISISLFRPNQTEP